MYGDMGTNMTMAMSVGCQGGVCLATPMRKNIQSTWMWQYSSAMCNAARIPHVHLALKKVLTALNPHLSRWALNRVTFACSSGALQLPTKGKDILKHSGVCVSMHEDIDINVLYTHKSYFILRWFCKWFSLILLGLVGNMCKNEGARHSRQRSNEDEQSLTIWEAWGWRQVSEQPCSRRNAIPAIPAG